ncbi:phosphotransferase [Mycoplasmatota bacterium zrk1]
MLGKLIGKGRTASVYEYDNKVVKLFNENVSKSWIDYEYRINKIVNDYQSFSPKVYEMVMIENKRGIVFEAITNETVSDVLKKQPLKTKAIAKDIAKVHLSIHEETANELENQIDYFTNKINLTKKLSNIQKEKIIAYIKTLPNDNKLCHGDLHTDNYLKQDDNYYVIDWTNAYSGCPASDIARTLLIMQSPSGKEELPLLIKPFVKTIINTLLKTFLKEYLNQSSLNNELIKAWRLPNAAARLIENVPCEDDWLIKMIEEDLKKIK